MQLQFLLSNSQERGYVRVIGYLQQHRLFVTSPHVNGKYMIVREGQPLAVRLLSGHSIMAFTVNVLRSCSRPYPYLHLSYPKKMQAITAHKVQRANFNGQVFLKPYNSDKKYEVNIEDISTSGALVSYPEKLGEVNDLLSMIMEVKFAGEDESLHLVCVLSNVCERVVGEEQCVYPNGLEFQFDDRQHLLAKLC